MKMLIIVCIMMLFCATHAGVPCPAQADTIGISTGANTGTYIKIAEDIKAYCTNLDIAVYTSAGSLENINRILDDEKMNFGIVQIDALEYDKKKLKLPNIEKVKMVFPLYNEEVHVIVKADSKIRKVMDLAGKVVNQGEVNSGNWITSSVFKDHLNIEWQERNFSPKEALKKLLSGDIDAMFYVAGKPIPALKELDEDSNRYIRLLSIDHPALSATAYIDTVIPKNTYPWQDYPVNTYAVKSVLVTYDYSKTGRIMVGNLVDCITDNIALLRQKGHMKWKEIKPLDYKQVKWPMHDTAKDEIIKKKMLFILDNFK